MPLRGDKGTVVVDCPMCKPVRVVPPLHCPLCSSTGGCAEEIAAAFRLGGLNAATEIDVGVNNNVYIHGVRKAMDTKYLWCDKCGVTLSDYLVVPAAHDCKPLSPATLYEGTDVWRYAVGWFEEQWASHRKTWEQAASW